MLCSNTCPLFAMSVPIGFNRIGPRFVGVTNGVCGGDCITLADGVSVGDCSILTNGVGKADEKDVCVGRGEGDDIDGVRETTVVVVCDVGMSDVVSAEMVTEIDVSKNNRVDKDGVDVRIAKEVFEAVNVTVDVNNSLITTVVVSIDGVDGIISEEMSVCSNIKEI